MDIEFARATDNYDILCSVSWSGLVWLWVSISPTSGSLGVVRSH